MHHSQREPFFVQVMLSSIESVLLVASMLLGAVSLWLLCARMRREEEP